ncbi:MAG: UDP-N-acetylglucosamine 2-epimerase (non-hydrolyzing) [Elusimicrobiota bacterium]|nr:UDP-N-acetylglucosamine 2-epimerase (non-hydrolyzing) [Endomicrobiia bacterium]MDW8166589.1 UDP-N-acetylglucosamine 2-epimerase (non-hydrolyzing) [Elusimicrobiota bacterium]
MKKILIFLGTRPEIIKLAPLIDSIKRKKTNIDIEFEVCFTGQHIEMASHIIEFFNIKPNYNLSLMEQNQDLNKLSGKLFISVDEVLERADPDLVIVQGDTTSAMISALASFHRKIKIAHIEAGLRSFNKLAPFPEEINRTIISRVADFNFVPTERAKENLLKENIDSSTIWVVGNTVVDAMLLTLQIIEKDSDLKRKIVEFFNERGILLNGQNETRIITVTMHRREHFGEKLENMCKAIQILAKEFRDIIFVFPVHLNPNVKKIVYSILQGVRNIILLEPLPYPYFIYLLSKSFLVLTDSGGIQEEAPSFNVPVLVLRDVTERIEGIEVGVSKLIGTQTYQIVYESARIIKDRTEYEKMQKGENPYGDGKASDRIVDVLLKYI